MSDKLWSDVDAYLADRLMPADAALDAVVAANAAGGLPAIDVSPPQGKMLHLIARMCGARRILEVGTLGGYSTVWFARAVPPDGTVVTLEIDPHHADVARANFGRAGVAEKVDLRVGAALDTMTAMQADGEAPFDLVFIDADKQNNANYLAAALKLSRPGTVIICDNVVRKGAIVEAEHPSADVQGTRRLFDAIAAEPRLDATAVQTVGGKGWDGFVLAIVS